MSLTSVELNYLIWRYLQESRFDLAAYAFSKDSKCLDYDHVQNKLIPSIEPGCLVNLVQKGILYTFLEESNTGEVSQLNIIDAILKDKADLEAAKNTELEHTIGSNTDAVNGGKQTSESGDIEMKDSENMLAVSADESATNNAEISGTELEFETINLSPRVTFGTSISSQWHPSTEVFASGNEDSTAVIYALGADGIAETVTLSHPPIVIEDKPVSGTVSVVSWSPQGSLLLTAGLGGELRAWAPDGRLKNIGNSVPLSGMSPASIQTIEWNTPGSLVLSINAHNAVSVWEGSSLSLLYETPGSDGPAYAETHACWVSESKFAVSTPKNAIKIYSVAESVTSVGQLLGHDNDITSLCFSPVSKLLASASDVDYAIKVWNSSSAQDALELNSDTDKLPYVHYHSSPIIMLRWISRLGDIQGNELISVSMEGAVNIWDAFTGDALVSANVFLNPDNFRFAESNSDLSIGTNNALVYAAAVSPNSRLLAIGDDAGTVSIWDIDASRYRDTKELLRCLGIFASNAKGETSALGDIGICDLAWDSKSHLVTVCYKGRDSVILKYGQESTAPN